MKYQPYPKYRASGIEWLGDIPLTWDSIQLKRSVVFFAGVGFPPDEQGRPGNELPFYKVKDLGNQKPDGKIGETEHSISRETAERLHASIIPPNTILMAKVGMAITLNRFCYADRYCCIDNNMMGITPKNADSQYIKFLLPVLRVSDYMNPGAVPSLSEEIIGNIYIPLPPRSTQRAIAAFLDAETARIDGLVKEYEDLIALLAEKRTSLISHAVTRGLSELVSPDDPEFGEWAKPVRFKDSGVEWIGEIPEEWEVSRIRYLFNVGRGRVIAQTELVEDGLFPVYSSQTLNNGCMGYISTYDFDCEQLTWTTDGANAGTVFLRKGKHNCTNVCGTLQKKSNSIDLDYYSFLLSIGTQHYKRPDTNGAKIMNNEMAVIEVPLPSKIEQVAIARFIARGDKKLLALLDSVKDAISLLKEHRSALITNAVTGKINVEGLA